MFMLCLMCVLCLCQKHGVHLETVGSCLQKKRRGFQMRKKLMKKHFACLLVTIMCLNTTGIHEVRATESGHTQIQTEQEDESGAETQAEQEDGSGMGTQAEQERTAEGTTEIGSEQEVESSERITETETDGDGSGESRTEDETISEEEEGTGSTRMAQKDILLKMRSIIRT